MSKGGGLTGPKTLDACPHCGAQLSPWQQVLLSVDRALMCKNCWYRIVLDVLDDSQDVRGDDSTKPKDVKK
jgi:DNA-directed RNA polymerase subunit RPC12/RpoP